MSIVATDVLEPKEVAQILKVSTRTVLRLAESGDLASFRVGDLWRFYRSDVETFIENERNKQNQRKRGKRI